MLNATRSGKVLRIELARSIMGKGWYWTTAYLVGQTLIDTGPAHTSHALLQHLQDTPIKRVFNTHAHEDHIGANGPLQRQRPDLKIFAHPDALPILADPVGKQPLQLYRRIMWGWPEPSRAAPLTDGQIIEVDDLRWQVLYTPGHTQHHLCFFELDHGWLFSGDIFVGGHDRAIGAGNDVWGIIASLVRLAELPVETLFPGAAKVRSNPKTALNERIDYLRDLGDRILALYAQGWEVDRIAREVSGGPMFIEFFTGGHFSRRHLVTSFLDRPGN